MNKNRLAIFLGFTLALKPSSADHCLKELNSNGMLWATKLGRTQVLNFVQHSASGTVKDADESWMIAKGRALSELKAECGKLPKKVKAFEKCQSGKYKSYIRYSVSKKDCFSNSNTSNSELENILSSYQKSIEIKKNLQLKKYFKEQQKR